MLSVVAVAATLALAGLLRTGLLTDRRYWITLAIVACFQVLVDGWLTCRPIVTYAPEAFSGVRLGCPSWEGFTAGGMPLEDVAFGWALVTQTLLWWRWAARPATGCG